MDALMDADFLMETNKTILAKYKKDKCSKTNYIDARERARAYEHHA